MKFLWPTLDKLEIFFLYWDSHSFDQSFLDDIKLDTTAISTPLDNVPLYSMQLAVEPIILLKSSQAASSSDRFSEGTPVTNARCSCPLNPVTQGLTVPTFFARQYTANTAAMTRKAAPPAETKP